MTKEQALDHFGEDILNLALELYQKDKETFDQNNRDYEWKINMIFFLEDKKQSNDVAIVPEKQLAYLNKALNQRNYRSLNDPWQ